MASTNASKDHIKDQQNTTMKLIGTSPNTLTVNGGIVSGQGTSIRPFKKYEPLRKPIFYDLEANVNGNLTGFRGAFTDGIWIYLVPNKLSASILSGTVARLLISDFTETNDLVSATPTVEFIDLSVYTGFTGFYGGFTDGRWAYYVPSFNLGHTTQGKIVRVDIIESWTLTPTIEFIDLELVSPRLKGFFEGFYDGRYAYLVPSYSGSPPRSGTIARIDIDAASWTAAGIAQIVPVQGVDTLDLRAVDEDLAGFWGGFTDGRHAYFVPYNNDDYSGKVARVPLGNFVTTAIEVLDLTAYDTTLRGFRGGFTDGRYGYLVPYYNGAYHGNFVRFDLDNFTATGGIKRLNLGNTNTGWVGFELAVHADRYAYLCPNQNNTSATLVRVDLDAFEASALDLSATDTGLVGYAGGVAVDGFVFLCPSGSGNVVRLLS